MEVKPKTRLFGERIQHVIDDSGVNQVELAKVAGVSKATVTEWITGRSKAPRPEALFAIEDKLFYSARWLATGSGPIKIKKFDPTDTVILEHVDRLSPTAKNAVREFIEFELHKQAS